MARSSDVGGHFAANVRRVRKQVGISQEALGFRAGLHRTEVGLLERGERVPRIDTLIKLAAGLEVEPAVLLEGIEWTEGETTVMPGGFAFSSPQEQHAKAMRLAAKAREGQSGATDAAELIREVRDEMEGRDCRAERQERGA